MAEEKRGGAPPPPPKRPDPGGGSDFNEKIGPATGKPDQPAPPKKK